MSLANVGQGPNVGRMDPGPPTQCVVTRPKSLLTTGEKDNLHSVKICEYLMSILKKKKDLFLPCTVARITSFLCYAEDGTHGLEHAGKG